MKTHLQEITLPEQRIQIRQRARGDSTGEPLLVEAPLPDNFGLTVGSEFATPFDTGNVNSLLSKLLTIANISQKASIRMKKMYANPTPTEVSFDMEFTSYYDAYAEVVVPSMVLMAMSLGRTISYPELKEDINKLLQAANKGVISAAEFAGIESLNTLNQESSPKGSTEISDAEKKASKAVELFNLIQGPPTVDVRFGKVLRFRKAFITSVGAKFSNVLDVNGYPTSGVCSVTITPQEAPIADDIYKYFSPDNYNGR